MSEQNIQGQSQGQRVEDQRSYQMAKVGDDEGRYEEASQTDLLSSPRQSELSLISESTVGQQRSQLGASHQTRELRDTSFIQVAAENQEFGRPYQGAASQDTQIQQHSWQHEMFALASHDGHQNTFSHQQLQMYQTQQDSSSSTGMPGQLGSTLGAQALVNRMSHIVQRQSFPQAPITDRQRQSVVNRDSMQGARQGLQGAATGGSFMNGTAYQAANNNQRVQSGMTNSVTNDRLSSVQFILSQSDRASQINHINVADPVNTEAEQQKLYLQWSLTQSGGLDSVETESHAKKPQQLIQNNYYSANSFNPTTTVKSEDYMSQFNSITVPILTDSQFKQAVAGGGIPPQLRPGEHQKPIIVNSMAPPNADCSTPSPSLNLAPSVSTPAFPTDMENLPVTSSNVQESRFQQMTCQHGPVFIQATERREGVLPRCIGHLERKHSDVFTENQNCNNNSTSSRMPQEQHAGEFDNILSSPSVSQTQIQLEAPAMEKAGDDVIKIENSLTAQQESASAQQDEQQRVASVETSQNEGMLAVESLLSSDQQTTEQHRFSQVTNLRDTQLTTQSQQALPVASEVYQTTVLSVEEAINASAYESCPQNQVQPESMMTQESQLQEGYAPLKPAQSSLSYSGAKPPKIDKPQWHNPVSSATAVKQGYEGRAESDASSEAEEEDSVAMISVRANNQFSLGQNTGAAVASAADDSAEAEQDDAAGLTKSELIMQAIERQHQAMQKEQASPLPPRGPQERVQKSADVAQTAQLPLPHELFSDSRPSEAEQPTLSAKVHLPPEIFPSNFASPEDKQEKAEPAEAEASPFALDSLESQARHAVNHVHSQVPPIDYQNLPINVSNLLLLQAASSIGQPAQGLDATNDSKQVTDDAVDQILGGESSEQSARKKAKKEKTSAPRLEMYQLEREAQRTRPLILTDSQLLTDEARSSSVSKDGDLRDSLPSDRSADEPRPELKPEELEREASMETEKREDSSTISLKQPLLDDKLIEVSDMNNTKGALNQSESKPEDEQISYLISRQTSQDESRANPDESASFLFSQTNNERLTLTSMGFTQEKQFPNQPSTSRKQYGRGPQFPQTSEKKGGQPISLVTHQHVPSIYFANSQSNHGANVQEHPMRQQSCSSFNNTTEVREGTSCASRQSYFVNALGQRISSEVLCSNQMHPADASLQSLFANNAQVRNQVNGLHQANLYDMGPVQEFGGETMSTIPDETHAIRADQSGYGNAADSGVLSDTQNMVNEMGRQIMLNEIQARDEQMIQVGLKEDQTAPQYPSTTRQSVTEINFNSLGDKSQLLNVQITESSAQNTHTLGVQKAHFSDAAQRLNNHSLRGARQMTLADDSRKGRETGVEGSEKAGAISVKRNLNFHDAFKTQSIPDQIHIQDEPRHFDQSALSGKPPEQQREADDESGSEHESAELMKSSSRPLQYQDDLPVFKSHDNMGGTKLVKHNRPIAAGYSLEAQQNFFQRYKSIKANGHEKNQSDSTNPQKCMMASVHPAITASDACSACALNEEVTNCQHLQNHAKEQSSQEKFDLIDDDDGLAQVENKEVLPLQMYSESMLQDHTTRSHHVTQEYFAEEYLQNHATNTEQQLDDLTDDDIAVFRSQPNDIPVNLAQMAIRKSLQTNFRQLQMRHQTTIHLSIEEADPIKLKLPSKSNSKHKRRSREVSLSTYQATEDDNTGAGLADRLSPKFEKLQQLLSMPSHQEHTKSSKAAGTNLMLRTVDPTIDGGIFSPPLASNPTAKSFLHRIASQQKPTATTMAFSKQLKQLEQVEMTPASARQSKMTPKEVQHSHEQQDQLRQQKQSTASVQQIIIQPSSPGNLSEDDTPGISRNDNSAVARDCQTTTNQEAKRRPSLMSVMYRHDGGFAAGPSSCSNKLPTPSASSNTQLNRRKSARKRNNPQHELTQFTVTNHQHTLANDLCRTQQTSLPSMKQQDANLSSNNIVPRDLQKWLSSLSLSQYGPLLVEQGLDDLNSLVLMMGQDRVLPLTHEVLEAAGIESSGHRARILVNLELEAGVYEKNAEIIELLQMSTMSQEEVARQADILFQTGAQMDQMSNPERLTRLKNQINQDNDSESRFGASPGCFSPLTEQILKGRADRSPLRPQQQQMASNKFASSLSLSKWLAQNNLLFLQPNFVRSGYECLRTLILQTFSQFNKLTDETLKREIGIEKIGHRMRILSQLRQDALVLFQMELLYRSSQKESKMMSAAGQQSMSHDDSLFILPGRQQRHFKSVYTDNNHSKNEQSMVQQQRQSQTQSQQYLLPLHVQHQQTVAVVEPPKIVGVPSSTQYHMSQQQPVVSKKLRPRNYSYSKGEGLGPGGGESVPSSMNTTYRQYQQLAPAQGQSRHKAREPHKEQQQQQLPGSQKANLSQVKEHLESNLNPWRHSTYFDQSRPVNSQTSHYSVQEIESTTRSQQVQLREAHQRLQRNVQGGGYSGGAGQGLLAGLESSTTQSMPQLPLMAQIHSGQMLQMQQLHKPSNSNLLMARAANANNVNKRGSNRHMQRPAKNNRGGASSSDEGNPDDKSCTIF